MQKTIMYLAVAGCLVIFLYLAKKRIDRRTATLAANAPAEDKKQPDMTRRIKDGETFVLKLNELGYFKYTDSQHLGALMDEMAKEFSPDSELPFYEPYIKGQPVKCVSLDLRHYCADNETLFEQGGFTALLNNMQPLFDKMGVVVKVSAHEEKIDHTNNSLNHSITINGTPYVIFKNFKESGWEQTMAMFTKIINTELKKQGQEEQLYPINAGNDGRVVLLTDEQFKYIYSVLKNKEWKPLPLEEWCKLIGLKMPEEGGFSN